MEISKAREIVKNHLEKIGYTKIETEPMHAFLHLIEEVGETARTLLYKETPRGTIKNTTKPEDLEEEVADIFWQTLKLAIYLDIDLEKAFIKKYEKNLKKSH